MLWQKIRGVGIVVLLLTLFVLGAFAQTPTFSGTADAYVASKNPGPKLGSLDLMNGPASFVDVNWGYLDHYECGANVYPCTTTFVHDPDLKVNAGYNQEPTGAPGCMGVCTYPGVPRDTFEGEGPSGTNNVQLDTYGVPTLGTPIGVQTSVTHDKSSSTSTCQLGYFASPFGPYTGIVNTQLGQVVPPDAMYQGLDVRSTATASCTPDGNYSVRYTFHHDYEKLGTNLPIQPVSPPEWFTQPICFDLNSGLPPFTYQSYLPLAGVTTPQPGTICFNQVLDQQVDSNHASITVATAVLTDFDGSTLMVCKTHADVSGCNTPPPPQLTLSCQSQGTGEVGTPFSSFLVAGGGTPPYVLYDLFNGQLPNGLTLNPTTGEISGIPTTAGDFNFIGRVTDSASMTALTPDQPGCHVTITEAKLKVVKTPKGGTFSQGQQVTFNIVVSSIGTSVVKDVVVTDQLPTAGGLTWTTTAAGCSISGTGLLACNLGNLDIGASVTIPVVSQTTTPAAACQYQPNPVVTASSSNADTVTDYGSQNCTPPPPQLAIQKTPDNGTFTMGSQVSYTIVVSNNGGSTAKAVTVTDALPTNGGLTWTSATTTQGTCTITSNNLSCTLGDIPVGGSVTITVKSPSTTPASACQSQPNPAAIAKSGTITVQDSGSQSCTPPPPQLKVVKTPDGATFTSGSKLTFTIVVSNPASAGSQSATNVKLSDQLPTSGGLSWTSYTATQGTCTIASSLLNCSLGTIAPGASVTITVTSTATTLCHCQAQNNPAAVATADGGLKAQDAGSYSCLSGYATYTPGGWGAPPSGGNVANTLKNNFYSVYGYGGITLGGTKTAKWTSALAIQNYLPDGGTPGKYTTSYTNPTTTSAYEFGSQLLALRLNIDFSAKGLIGKPSLANLTLTNVCSTKLVGYTVSQIYTISNTAIGGGSLPSGVTYSDLTNIMSAINGNFDGGTTNHGCLQ